MKQIIKILEELLKIFIDTNLRSWKIVPEQLLYQVFNRMAVVDYGTINNKKAYL